MDAGLFRPHGLSSAAKRLHLDRSFVLQTLKFIMLPVQCLVKLVGVWTLETACAAVKTYVRATVG